MCIEFFDRLDWPIRSMEDEVKVVILREAQALGLTVKDLSDRHPDAVSLLGVEFEGIHFTRVGDGWITDWAEPGAAAVNQLSWFDVKIMFDTARNRRVIHIATDGGFRALLAVIASYKHCAALTQSRAKQASGGEFNPPVSC